MKYIVNIYGTEHMFPFNNVGYTAAVELAVASKRDVYLEESRNKLIWKYDGKLKKK